MGVGVSKGKRGKSEYELYHSSERMKHERALRNKNRRQAEREGRVHKGDGREIDHKNGRVTDNSPKNLRVISRHANRVKQ